MKVQCRPHTLTPTPAHAVDDNRASEDEDDEEEDDNDEVSGEFSTVKSKERLEKGVARGRAAGKQPASDKKRAREAEGGKKEGGVSRKKSTVKVSDGGAGGAGGAKAPTRGPLDYDANWGTRSCTFAKCTRLDFDPVSETYKSGEPCGGLCKRSSAYQYCQANNIEYRKFGDGKFYDPEKYD